MDGHGNRELRRELLAYLRWQLQTVQSTAQTLKDIRTVDSKSDVLVQLADMVAGTIRRSSEGQKQDAVIYKKIIERRIEDEWNFGR